MNDDLPPFRIWPHFQAAFGGVFGALNLAVGAVNIFRQIARAFDVGLSPVLKDVLAAYVQIFHGTIEILAAAMTQMTGLNMSVPVWAHDWIILWFVLAGAAARVVLAAYRVVHMATEDGGFLIQPIDWPSPFLTKLTEFLIDLVPGFWTSPTVTHSVLAYLVAVFIWPIILIDVVFSPTRFDKRRAEKWRKIEKEGDRPGFRFYRFSYRSLFLLQTLAIVLAVLGLSVLNAQVIS